jgi:hypothetical protein
LDHPYALSWYQQWFEDLNQQCVLRPMDQLSIFYWEERLGNWGTQTQIDKDIAQEEFNLFNSRGLITLYLSVNARHLTPPHFYLHKRIIKALWPETLDVPINPGFRDTVQKALKPLGLVDLYRCLKYSRLNGY